MQRDDNDMAITETELHVQSSVMALCAFLFVSSLQSATKYCPFYSTSDLRYCFYISLTHRV